MKRRVLVFLALCLSTMLLMGLVGCGRETGTKTEGTQGAGTAEKTTLVVGFDQNFPPFGYVGDDGEFTGFDIELATECASRMGKEIELQPIDWDAKDLELESGKIDCIWNGFTINGREDSYTWTEAYMDNSQVVVVRTDSGIKTLADLKDKNVMVQTDSSAQSVLDGDQAELTATFASGKYQTTAEYNTAMLELETGAVDAVAMDIFVAQFQLEGRSGDFLILDEQLSTEQYGVGFLKGNTQLRDEVQTTLKGMVADGTFATISDKYFGTDVGTLSAN